MGSFLVTLSRKAVRRRETDYARGLGGEGTGRFGLCRLFRNQDTRRRSNFETNIVQRSWLTWRLASDRSGPRICEYLPQAAPVGKSGRRRGRRRAVRSRK